MTFHVPSRPLIIPCKLQGRSTAPHKVGVSRCFTSGCCAARMSELREHQVSAIKHCATQTFPLRGCWGAMHVCRWLPCGRRRRNGRPGLRSWRAVCRSRDGQTAICRSVTPSPSHWPVLCPVSPSHSDEDGRDARTAHQRPVGNEEA